MRCLRFALTAGEVCCPLSEHAYLVLLGSSLRYGVPEAGSTPVVHNRTVCGEANTFQSDPTHEANRPEDCLEQNRPAVANEHTYLAFSGQEGSGGLAGV